MKKTKTRRILYLALTILFALCLAADIGIALFLPEQQSFSPFGNMPDFSQMSESGERPEMPDMENMPDFSESGEAPDFSNMPDFSGGEMPDFSQSSGSSGILYSIKTYALPIGLGCALLSLLCLWLFIRSKPKAEPVEDGAEAETKAVEEEEQPRKKKKPVTGYVLLALAIIGTVSYVLKNRAATDESSVEVVEENRSTEVTVGSLETALLGSGSLSESESESLSYAGDVRILSWEVGENEVVAKGQTLATVDKNSVLASISELTELMSELDSALESSRSDSSATTVTAPVAGRIVAVYAEKGETVQSVIAEHGALMVLSLDGRLSVDIAAGELSAGDALQMKLSDGSLLDAVVSEISEGIATVTVGDSLADYGESVSVLDESGAELGSGTLGAHRPLGITGFNGTVSAVYGKQGAAVSESQTLLTLTDTDYTGEYESLLEKRRVLEQQVEELYALYNAGALVAGETGYVSNLNTAAVGLSDSSAKGSSSGFPFSLSSESSQKGSIQLLACFRDSEGHIVTLSDVLTCGDTPGGNIPGGDTPAEEVETYTVIATVTAVDSTAGTLSLSTTDGSSSTLKLTELVGKCGEADVSSIAVGNLLLLKYRSDDNSLYSCTVYTPAGSGSSEQKGSGGTGGGFSYSGSSSAAATVEETYIAQETELCTLTVFNKADIVLSVDELDIQSLYVGQQVEVTLDALEAQLFTATVSEIDPNGSNSGGNTKYSVTVTMERSSDMLSGMNASVRVPLEKHDSLVLLSAEAIQEDESGVYVYTAYDEKNGYTGRVDITTGLSDGTMVEITSGLSEGDTVYYPFADTLKYTFTK